MTAPAKRYAERDVKAHGWQAVSYNLALHPMALCLGQAMPWSAHVSHPAARLFRLQVLARGDW